MNVRSSLAVELEKMPRALRASELAKILSTSKMTIYRLVEQGAIPHFRVGGLIRFDPQTIAAAPEDAVEPNSRLSMCIVRRGCWFLERKRRIDLLQCFLVPGGFEIAHRRFQVFVSHPRLNRCQINSGA